MAGKLKECRICGSHDIDKNVFLSGSIKVGDFYYLKCTKCGYHTGYFSLSEEDDMYAQWNHRP